MFHVRIERSAEKALARISEPWQGKLQNALRKLAGNPRPSGVVKLTGRDAWRIRVADYRIIYEIHDDLLLVLVVDVGHRREIYR
jgi:mRNA interferase RelE/StbE